MSADSVAPSFSSGPSPSTAGCEFCSIVAGRTRAHLVLEAPDVLAFLDRRPLFPGHLLVVPREHYGELGELPADLVGPLFEQVQRLEAAVVEAMEADGSFVALNNRVSQSVPHLHVHVVPRRRKDGLRGFFWPRTPYPSEAEAAAVAAAVRSALAGLPAKRPGGGQEKRSR